MARATASPTPNPDAMKFVLDVPLPGQVRAAAGETVPGPAGAFAGAVLALDGVASVFGVNDFLTVTRRPGAPWEPIVCGVEEAAAAHLAESGGEAGPDQLEAARQLLREAVARPAAVPVDLSAHRRPPRQP